jgi:hypothetical protein
MDKRYFYLLEKYRQERAGFAPWPFINTLPDAELERDLAVATALSKEYDANTYEAAVGGGTIRGWIAQALRARPQLLGYPAYWPA